MPGLVPPGDKTGASFTVTPARLSAISAGMKDLEKDREMFVRGSRVRIKIIPEGIPALSKIGDNASS